MFFALVIAFVIFLWYKISFGHRDKLFSKIPSPYKYPLIHNAFEFMGLPAEGIFKWLERTNASLGSVYHWTNHLLSDGIVVVSDPKLAETLLTSQKLIDKGEGYELLREWLGTGLLISSGKKWFQRRKILTPAFHFSILEKFVEIMDEQGQVLVEKLKKLDGEEVDFFPLANLYALDVICGIGIKYF